MILLKIKYLIEQIKNTSPILIAILFLLAFAVTFIILYCGTYLGKLNEHPIKKWIIRIICILSLIMGILYLSSKCNCSHISSETLSIFSILILITIILFLLKLYYEFAIDSIPTYKFPTWIYGLLVVASFILATSSIVLIFIGGLMLIAQVEFPTSLILFVIGLVILIPHLIICIYLNHKNKQDASI